jgi:hypothetical protein
MSESLFHSIARSSSYERVPKGTFDGIFYAHRYPHVDEHGERQTSSQP